MTKARALLDSAAPTSFVTGRLVRQLQLPLQCKYFQVAGIGGKAHGVSHFLVSFDVANSNNTSTPSGRHWKVEAIVLPKVTTKLPASPVPFSANWKHLQGLQLANQRFGVPDSVQIMILGANIFRRVMLHSRWRDPPGYPTALRTQYGWVLMGVVDPELDNR